MKSLISLVAGICAAVTPSYGLQAETAPQPLVAMPSQPSTNGPALPANTEITLSMNEDLTTKGGRIDVGTQFDMTVTQDVRFQDLVVIPKGSRGVGEVTWLTGKGAFGKSGKMEIELRYIDVNGNRVPIVGKFRQEGEGNTVATIGAVVAVGVFGAFVTGKSAKVPRGRELIAYTKDPVPLLLPDAAN